MEWWLPTDSGLQTPRLKTRVKKYKAYFSGVPAKFPRWHLPGSGDKLIPEPVSERENASQDGVTYPPGSQRWSQTPDTLGPWEGRDALPTGKLEKGGWGLGKPHVCCSYLTVKLSRTRYPRISYLWTQQVSLSILMGTRRCVLNK